MIKRIGVRRMKKELQNKLYNDFPKLFAQKDLTIQESCMPWGICTGDGWYNLIRNLCAEIQAYVDYSGIEQVEFSQIKEKFGQLRAYIDNGDEKVYDIIRLAETLSSEICESCGMKGYIKSNRGWLTSMCDECRESRRNRFKED